MAYTEIKAKNDKKYYYRVRTLRQVNKFKKNRIYLGKNLSKKELLIKEKQADEKLRSQKEKEKLKETKKLITKIRKILKKHKIKKAGIFGSHVHGKQKKNSDIDILVKPTKKIMGFEFAGLSFELEEKLKKKVDLLTYNSISPHIEERVLKEEVRII